MHRRILLTGLAVLTSIPVFAQQGSRSSGQQTSSAQAGQLDKEDTQHITQTLAGGSLALESSKIALQKAQNPLVKQFAQFEADEQQTLSEVLRSFQRDAATTASAAAESKSKDALQKLQQAEAGKEFDREYVQLQLHGHQQLLALQETYLKSGNNQDLVNVTKLARGHIKEHVEVLQRLNSELGRG
jgi:putative membrane protein